MNRVAYKYRIYPNNEQKEYFAKCFGCVRFFYNKSLSDMIEYHKTHKDFKNITPATYKDEFPFLKEVDSLALANAQLNRNFSGVIKSATISKTTDDKYYISLLVETEIKPLERNDNSIGLDLGVKDIVITSNGHKYKNHKYLTRSQNKLTKEQRKLSKMVKGSNNRNKQRIKVARLHKHIQNQRNDYLHKLSKKIIDENQIICVEDLKVMNMTKDNDYNKSLLDSSMSKLLTMLTYKASWYRRTIVKIPSDYPSSQLCSSCGYKNSITKNLSVRTWTCPHCQSKHDRDINAAKNILSKGIEILTKDGTHPDSLFMLGSLGSSSKKPPLI